MKDEVPAGDDFQTEQTRLLYAGFGHTLLGRVATATALVLVMRPHAANPLWGWIWLGLLIAVTGLRALLVLLYHRASPQEREVPRWLNYWTLFTLISGVTWGAAAWMLFPSGFPAYQALLMLGLMGIASDAMAIYAYRPSLTIAFTLLLFSGAEARLLWEGTPFTGELALILILYLAFLLRGAQVIGEGFAEVLRLRSQSERREVALRQTQEATDAGVRVSHIGKGEQVLVVDDDPAHRALLAGYLARAGFKIRQAQDGAAAIATLREWPADLVITDALMPTMDGYTLCGQLRAQPATRNLPVVIVTGQQEERAVRRAFEAGATCFSTKPLNLFDLSHSLRFILRATRTANELREKGELLGSAERLARLGYWRWRVDDQELEISDTLASLCGHAQGNRVSLETCLGHTHPEDRDRVHASILDTAASGQDHTIEFRLRAPAEEGWIQVQQHLRFFVDPEGKGYLLGTIQDISDLKQAEDRVRRLAFYDELTGLASRTHFYHHLADSIRVASRRRESFALIYLDLDGFKDINDSLGHDQGDLLLREVARRLRSVLRDADFAARLGGDEFCIVTGPIADGLDLGEVARRCLDTLHAPLRLRTHEIRPRASIGIALYPHDGTDPEALVRAGDTAMYAAKDRGRHRYAFYDSAMTRAAERRMQLETALRLALDRGEFRLDYQPQVALADGRLQGVEALIRWQRPGHGLVPPEQFIPLAEHIGLMSRIGEWVLETACWQILAWDEMGAGPLEVAVNVSPTQLQHRDFVVTVGRILERTGLAPERLELEITEGLTRDPEEYFQVCDRIRALGVRVAIDDFGTGYSSLSVLKDTPVDVLKVDRAFVRDLCSDPQAAVLLGTILGMARALGFEVVAEGVETLEQLEVLRGLNCPLVQGWFFSPPLPADAIPELVARGFPPPSRFLPVPLSEEDRPIP